MLDSTLIAAIDDALAAHGSRRFGREQRFRCPLPEHEDRHPSARWNGAKGVWFCDVCVGGGGAVDLARRLGIVVGGRRFAAAPVKLTPMGVGAYDVQHERRERERAALAELRDAQANVFLHGAIRRADPELADAHLRAMYEALGDPYLREQCAEERLDAIEAEDRAEREEGVRRAA